MHVLHVFKNNNNNNNNNLTNYLYFYNKNFV